MDVFFWSSLSSSYFRLRICCIYSSSVIFLLACVRWSPLSSMSFELADWIWPKHTDYGFMESAQSLRFLVDGRVFALCPGLWMGQWNGDQISWIVILIKVKFVNCHFLSFGPLVSLKCLYSYLLYVVLNTIWMHDIEKKAFFRVLLTYSNVYLTYSNSYQPVDVNTP